MGDSILFTLPEVILSVSSLLLLLAAAWGGDNRTSAISVVAVAALVAAGFVAASPVTHGSAFQGLYTSDAFSAFSKVLIYGAAAVSIIIAPRFFAREAGLRAEYPILILLSAVGMGMMVSATDLLTLYVGLELQSLAAYVLASFMRRDNRSAEAGLKYFVLGALASGILLYGISLLYGFTGTTIFSGIANAASDGISTGELFGLVFAGRLRRCAHAGNRLLRLRAEGCRHGAAGPRVDRSARPCEHELATDRDLRGAGLYDPWRRGRDRPEQHQTAARL